MARLTARGLLYGVGPQRVQLHGIVRDAMYRRDMLLSKLVLLENGCSVQVGAAGTGALVVFLLSWAAWCCIGREQRGTARVACRTVW